MIRLFVAIGLPAEVRARLAGLQGGVGGARWVAPENLHLSLRFIGEVAEPAAADIAQALSRVEGAPFDLAVEGCGHFGTGRRLRALWAGVRPSEPLTALQARIERCLVRAGLAPEGRRFTPHVTLARIKGRARGAEAFLAANAAFRSESFTVTGFTLFSSFLSRSGALYRPEAEFALTEGGR